MVKPARESAPWFLWPVAALWDLLAFVLRLTGRLVGVLISLVLLVLGAVLTMTVVGAPIGPSWIDPLSDLRNAKSAAFSAAVSSNGRSCGSRWGFWLPPRFVEIDHLIEGF